MAFVPFTRTIKIEPVFTYGSQICENVFHFILSFDPTPEAGETLAALVKDWWTNNMIDLVAPELILTKVKWSIMEAEDDPAGEDAGGLPVSGTGASPQLPNNVTCVVRWATGLRGRSHRGRTYHLGLMESQVQGNTLLPSVVSDLTIEYLKLKEFQVIGAPATLAVASRIADGVERTQGVITPVTSVFIDAIVDSQRRRLPGRGA
jgi:hypothetical protein